MTAIRMLTAADHDAAVDLVEAEMATIPLYAWILGDARADETVRRWLGRLLVRSAVTEERAVGAFDDDRLLGAIFYSVPAGSDADPDTTEASNAATSDADLRMALSIPGLAERLSATDGAIPTAAQTGMVSLNLSAVRRDVRRRGLVWQLMEPIEELCRELDCRFCVWTADPDYRDGWMARWGVEHFDTRDMPGFQLYGLRSDKPPRPRKE